MMNQGVFDVIEKVLARLEVHISFFVPAERTLHKACNWILCIIHIRHRRKRRKMSKYIEKIFYIKVSCTVYIHVIR